MSNKLVMAVFIIGFWLIYPLPFMFMEDAGFDNTLLTGDQIKEGLESNEIISASDQLTTINPKNYMTIYFDIFFTGIPNAGFFVNRFINFMQLVSGLILYLLIRRD